MKPLREILAVTKDLGVEERIERLRYEIEQSGLAWNASDLFVTVDEYVTDVSLFLTNIVLDVAEQVGALPEGRDKAWREAELAMVWLKTIAMYKALALRDSDEEDADGNT